MPTKKEIPETGSDTDVTLSETDSVTIIICEFCTTNPCRCKFIICPFHGKIKARDETDGTFRCTGENCSITRTEKELE